LIAQAVVSAPAQGMDIEEYMMNNNPGFIKSGLLNSANFRDDCLICQG
jgi:hypothetical protein